MWILMRDHFILDGCFDTSEEAYVMKRHYERRYQGFWEVKRVDDSWLHEYTDSVTDIDFVHAVGDSYQSIPGRVR